MQSGFHENRDVLAGLGVHYAGRDRQARRAASVLAFGHVPAGMPGARLSDWDDLVEEVRQSRARRVVISSETFAHCDDAAADRAVAALDADRLHVVITMRPLADMLPSAWQQYVRESVSTPYEQWLRSILAVSLQDTKATKRHFWRRTRIDLIARRWAERLGPDRVTVVSLAGREPDYVLRAFEHMLAIPDGTLVPGPGSGNSSLPYEVVETVRRFNELYEQLPDGSRDEHLRLVERGMLRRLTQLPQSAATGRIAVPAWAAQRCEELMQGMNENLRGLGVNVLGDLDGLARPSRPPADVPAPDQLPVAAGAQLVLCALQAARREGYQAGRAEGRARAARREPSGREALQMVARRLRARLKRSV